MPKKTYVVDTDKGSYEVDVDEMRPVDPNPLKEFARAGKEGFQGFVKGLLPGVASGVVDVATLPIAFIKELAATAEGAGRLSQDPVNTLTEFANTLKGLPGHAYDAVMDYAALAERDPEAFGREVGKITGETEGGIVTGKAASRIVPLAPKPIVRKLGEISETIGTKGQWPIRMMGAHQLGSGNPMGVLTMALPETLQAGGAKLTRFGGGLPIEEKELQAAWADAMANRNVTAYDERAASQAATAKAATTDAAAQSQYAGTIRTRLGRAIDTAPNPATQQLSDLDAAIAQRAEEAKATRTASVNQEQIGRKAEERADYEDLPRTKKQQADSGVDPRIAQLMARNRGMTAETAQRALTLSDQAAVGGSVRPPIQPVGQAATDLANGPVAKARPLYNQQAAAENIANGSSYNNGHVLQDPKPTELSDLVTEGPDTGMVYDAEHGVAVPRDLSFEAGHPDVPGLTVGKAGTNPLSNRPAPKGSIRVGKGPLDDILGPEGPKGAFDWPEAGGRFEPDATGSHVRKAPSTPAYSPVRSQQEFLDRTKALYESAGKKFTDNAAVTAANAYSSGARVPEDVLQDFFQKTKNRQADHIADHYLQNRQIPE